MDAIIVIGGDYMEAVNQLASTFIWCALVIGWLGIAVAVSGMAVLIYRAIRMPK
jgi:hypothetical protein